MATAHIAAEKGAFAKTVLMPGDPLRSKFIAETFLENPVLVNNVRGVQGYTGTYKGVPVSVMASGMGIPSIGIYSYELYSFFGVENIIRIGSAGAISDKLQLRDIVAGMSSHTNSNFAAQYNLPGTYAPTADYTLLSTAVESAKDLGLDLKVGPLLSSDTFYDDDEEALRKWAKMGALAVEMESAGRVYDAAVGKRALAMVTISDMPFTGEATTPGERAEHIHTDDGNCPGNSYPHGQTVILSHSYLTTQKPVCRERVCQKMRFYTFARTRKGLGNEGVNTFAPQMPAINGCPHLLRCGVSQIQSAVGIHFRRGKGEVSRLFADGTSPLYFCLFVKGLNEMSL